MLLEKLVGFIFKIFCYIIGKRHLWCRDFASCLHYVMRYRWQRSEFHIWWFCIYINTKMLTLITLSLNVMELIAIIIIIIYIYIYIDIFFNNQ